MRKSDRREGGETRHEENGTEAIVSEPGSVPPVQRLVVTLSLHSPPVGRRTQDEETE